MFVHIAISAHVNATRALIEHGADVNARNSERSTALHLAACWGAFIAKILLKIEQSFDVNSFIF